MKRYFHFLSVCSVLFFMIVSGCKKEISKIVLEEGAAPVITSSTTGSVPLAYATEDEQALKLTWTNPEYKFTTGVSSQDVNYLVEIDTAGANFTSTIKKSISVKNDLSKAFTQKELNIILVNDMSLVIGTLYTIQARVTSSLSSNSAVPFTSNVLEFEATPYQDPTLLPPDLYITGDGVASSWTNTPPADQKFTYLGNKKYEITLPLIPGKQYKFLSKFGQWQPQYGSTSSTGGALQVNDGTTTDPPGISTPAEAGNYKITVNLGAMTYTIEKI